MDRRFMFMEKISSGERLQDHWSSGLPCLKILLILQGSPFGSCKIL